MISQINNDLWREIFDHHLNGLGITREDVANYICMAWDRVDQKTNLLCAVGIFCLNYRAGIGSRRFFLVRGKYINSCGLRIVEVSAYLSEEKNQDDALLGIYNILSADEKEWLMMHLYLRHHPAYQE